MSTDFTAEKGVISKIPMDLTGKETDEKFRQFLEENWRKKVRHNTIGGTDKIYRRYHKVLTEVREDNDIVRNTYMITTGVPTLFISVT